MPQNHNSDIRLGSQLLTTATIICTGFAVAALVVYLRGDSILVEANNESPPETSSQQQLSAESTEQEQLEDIRIAEAVAAVPSPFESIEQNINTVASHRPRLTQVASQTNTTSHERPYDQGTSLPGEHGVYVPVNVHPVTVNIDGTEFSEQLARVANSVDQMLATHSTMLKSQKFSENSRSTGESSQDQLSRQEERLTQIDASLRELSTTVESLRTQSQAAAENQNDSSHQAELTTQLMVEFDNTLTNNRQLLADASRTSSVSQETCPQVLSEVEMVQIEPELNESPAIAPENEFIEKPATVTANEETSDDSIESDEAEFLLSAEPELQIKLEPPLDLEANKLISEPVSLEPLLPEAVEPSIVPAPNLQLVEDPIGMHQATDITIPVNRVPAVDDSQHKIIDRTSAPALVEADAFSQELNLSLLPKKEETVTVFEKTRKITGSAPVIPGTDPSVAHKKNYRFARPPTSNPLPFTSSIVPPVQAIRTTQRPQPIPVDTETRTQLFPKFSFRSRKSASSKSNGSNRKYRPHSNRQVATRASRSPQRSVQPHGYVAHKPVAPTQRIAAPVCRCMPTPQQPAASHILHKTRPHPMQKALSDGVNAATDIGGNVRDRTIGMLSRLTGPSQPATQPQHAYHPPISPQYIQHQHAHREHHHPLYQDAEHKPPAVLHRVSAAIRGVGRSRSVE